MKRFLLAILAGLIAVAPVSGLAGQTAVPAQEYPGSLNYLVNPGFENGKYGWTASGGATTTVDTTAKGEGSYGYDWDSNGAAQTLISNSITVPNGLQSRNGLAYCSIKAASGTATHTITVDDGTNDLVTASTIVSSTTQFVRQPVNFIFPSSGSVRLKIKSVNANEPAIYIDSCYLGEATNTMQITQAQFIGSAYQPTTASCTITRTNTALGAFTTAASCVGPTVENNPGPGTIQTTDANDPTIYTVNNLPSGNYEVCYSLPILIGTSNQQGALAINDGTTTFGQTGIYLSTAGQVAKVCGFVSYTTTANRTFQIYGSSAANQVSIDASANNARVYFDIKRYPTSQEMAVRTDQRLASYTGYQNAISGGCTTTSATYADFSACTSIALTQTTNRNMTVTTAASSAPGIAVTFPWVGLYHICAIAGAQVNTGVNVAMSLRLVDSSSTIIDPGEGFTAGTTGVNQSVPLCGDYNVTSIASAITFKIQGATNGNTLKITNGTATGSGAIQWSIIGLDSTIGAPNIVNSVMTGVNGVTRLAWASVAGTCTASPCTMAAGSDTVDISSITRTSAGLYVVNFTAGAFSAAPTCTVNYVDTVTTTMAVRIDSIPTTSSFTFDVRATGSGTATDKGFTVTCIGNK